MLKWLWLSVLVLVLDQASKIFASQTLVLHSPMPVFPFFNLTLMHNTGAAFSFLAHAGGWQRWFFTLIAIAVSVGIVVWLRRLERQQVWSAVALTLVLGGALGNAWDRLWLGYVVDFLDLYYQQWHWPAFNIADMAISAGMVMLVLEALFPRLNRIGR